MTFIKPFRPNYGTGTDGVLALSGTVTKQVYNLANGSSISGLTLSRSYKPSIIRCNGTLTISGAINGDAMGHGGSAETYKGSGPGGGDGGPNNTTKGGGGGGGSFGTSGTAGGASVGYGGYAAPPGWVYAAPLIDLFLGTFSDSAAGSAGGNGGLNITGPNSTGLGGYGGGGVWVIARNIVVQTAATIYLRGGAGANSTANQGAGGGASGGFLGIVGETIALPASGIPILATGGLGGTSDTPGGDGGNGRVLFCYISSITPSDAANRSNPVATVIDLSKLPVSIG